ncbi:MAG: hypothetical protein ACRBDL_06875 [Alphaproteobacteria bacterium]
MDTGIHINGNTIHLSYNGQDRFRYRINADENHTKQTFQIIDDTLFNTVFAAFKIDTDQELATRINKKSLTPSEYAAKLSKQIAEIDPKDIGIRETRSETYNHRRDDTVIFEYFHGSEIKKLNINDLPHEPDTSICVQTIYQGTPQAGILLQEYITQEKGEESTILAQQERNESGQQQGIEAKRLGNQTVKVTAYQDGIAYSTTTAHIDDDLSEVIRQADRTLQDHTTQHDPSVLDA